MSSYIVVLTIPHRPPMRAKNRHQKTGPTDTADVSQEQFYLIYWRQLNAILWVLLTVSIAPETGPYWHFWCQLQGIFLVVLMSEYVRMAPKTWPYWHFISQPRAVCFKYTHVLQSVKFYHCYWPSEMKAYSVYADSRNSRITGHFLQQWLNSF